MSTSTPLVTVVVPAFNELPHIVRASLESIRVQTLVDFECIVVDESTRPESAEACRAVCAQDRRFIYVHPSQKIGLARSLNLAMSKARGQLIARFDSDDVCVPERLALQVAFLKAHPEISVVGGAIDIINTEGCVLASRRYPLTPTEIAKGMQFTTTIAHPTVMYRREAIEQHGMYNPEFRFSEDLDLWLRWINAGICFANLPQVLVHYRQDVTARDQRHWRFNLRARVANFRMKYAVRRVLGIFFICMWIAMPNILKKKIFKELILRPRNEVNLG